MNFLFNTVTTAASYLNPFSYLSSSGSSLSGEGGITGYNQVTIRDGSVPVDEDNDNTTAAASNHREKSPSQQRPQREYFFAKHIVDETNDFRYLARRYHMGVRQEQEQEEEGVEEDNYNYYNHQFRRCKICNVEPATFFVSDLNGVFVNDNNSSMNNNNNNNNSSSSSSSNTKKTYKDVVNSAHSNTTNNNIDAASPEGPQVQICFECFILAFRSMVLPELVQHDPLQTKAIAKMIQDIDEAALNDYHIPSNSSSSSSPSSGDASQNTTPNPKNKNNSNSTNSSSTSPNHNKYKYKKLLCVRCRYPCTEDADFCPACHASTPWSIRCESCHLSARNSTFPPICPDTKQAHVLWSCEACTVTNTLDTPECSVCNTVRTWKCPRCDFGQRSRRTKSGERNCSKCGYTFSEMSTTSIRKLGLEEESVRRTDKVLHERQRTTYKIDQRMDELFDEIRDRMAEELHAASLVTNNKKSKSRSSSSASPSSKRASPVVLAARLKRVEQQGDGNCAFRSIAFNLFGTPNGHMLVRKAVCHGLTQRKQELLPWFENEDGFRNYVALMEQSGTWADEMALRIAAIIFGVNVHVISSDDAHWHFQFSPFAPSFAFDPEEDERQKKLTKKQMEQELKKKKEKEATRPHIFLAYSAPVHYDSLAICFEVVHPSDVSSSTERRNQQNQQKSTGSFDHVSDQEDDLVNNNNNEDSSHAGPDNNNDDEVEVLMPQPVSIPQLIAKLTKEFAQEEDQWVDVE